MNIAMWSGPRNLSTAMMYSFAARGDTDVFDEPFYGAYLHQTGADHPMAPEVIASMQTDPAEIVSNLTVPSPRHRYAKHMTHHMIPEIPRDWFGQVRHVFLIRHPARVIASYQQKRERPVLDDIGFVQQAEIFDQVRALGHDPIVIDSFDVRAAPGRSLQTLCEALGLAWTDAMLSWPSGGHSSDGVWAAHWYGAVHRSTGFAGLEGALPLLPDWANNLCGRALPYFEHLSAHKLGS